MDIAALGRLEAKRLELQASVDKLRKYLRHWQALELDYEGLREEFNLLDSDASEEQCLKAAREFCAEKLDEKDLLSLMKDASKHPNDRPRQLSHILERRVDYVQRNVSSIRKNFEGEQEKLNAVLLAEDEDTREDAGLPLGEILEELDEKGNVVNSRVEHAGGKTEDLAKVLEKVGVEGISAKGGIVTAEKKRTTKTAGSEKQQSDASGPSGTSTPSTKSERSHAAAPVPEIFDASAPAFRSEIIPMPGSLPATSSSTTSAQMRPKNPEPSKITELDDDDSDTDSTTSLPRNFDDTEDEALLREDMITYNRDNLADVNAIVAQLDLEEGASDVSYDDDSDNPNFVPDSDLELDDDDLDDLGDEDSEDEKGASKHLDVDSKYKRQMQLLQEKLGLQVVGPEGVRSEEVKKEFDRLSSPRPSAAEAARKAAIDRFEKTDKDPITGADVELTPQKSKKSAKKKVAFSESLDIADEAKTRPSTTLPARPKVLMKNEVEPSPITDTILERPSSPPNLTGSISSASPPAPPAPSGPKSAMKPKLSRFKQQMKEKPAPAAEPTPPQDRLVAANVLERDTPSGASAPTLDGIDDELHRKQMAIEFHKLKSKKIHDQGGYVKHDIDQEEEDIDDDWYETTEDGGVRKVSKFKAARLR